MEGGGELDSLITILDRIHASESIVFVEPNFVPLLSALAPYSTLQQHGVKSLIPLTDQTAEIKQNGANSIVYITSASPQAVFLVSKNIKIHLGHKLTVVLTPEIPPSVPLLFTRFGVLGDIDLVSWPSSLIPDAITPKLLSLFHTESATDPAAGVWPLVWALDALQANVSGAFGKMTTVGPKARLVASLLDQRKAERAVTEQQKQPLNTPGLHSHQFAEYQFGYSSSTFFGSEIEHAIIIDRDVDLVTPTLCQTTYEGVLAETVGISASGTTQSELKTSLRNDPVFASIAESAFAEACESLHQSAKELQQEYRAGNSANNPEQMPSIAEIRSVVSKLGSLQATQRLVDTHTELASVAMAALERGVRREAFNLQSQILESRITNTQAVARIQDLIFQGASITVVLRLLSLLCLVRGGLKENVLQALLYGDILKTYGYEHLKTIHYLYERGFIFSPKGSSFLFSASPLASFAGFSGNGSNTAASANAAPNSSTNGNGITNSTGGVGNNSTTGSAPAASVATSTGDGSSVLRSPLSQTYSWYSLNKAYKTYPSESEEAKAHAGVVPLTARIVQMALGMIPKAKTPLEPEFSEHAFVSKDNQSAREAKLRRTLLRNSPQNSSTSGDSKPIVLVVIVGGVTYAEATAIKQAATAAISARASSPSASESKQRNVVVASTSVITGDNLVLK